MNRLKQQDHLIELLGIEEAFDSVVKAMSDDQFQEIYSYICKCWDIPEATEEQEA